MIGGDPFGGAGGDRLSHALRRSTMGAERFHVRVRKGIGWFTLAMTTSPSKRISQIVWVTGHRYGVWMPCQRVCWRGVSSIGLLGSVSFMHCCTSTPDLSTWWSSTALIARPGFEVGFPLRCFQRLSLPYIATQLCRWHDNWSTRGTSTPVLSY